MELAYPQSRKFRPSDRRCQCEFFATDIDHELSGVVPLSLGRTYNPRFVTRPLLEHVGGTEKPWLPFGPGWRATWFAELRVTMSGFVYTRADGVEFLILDPDGDKSLAQCGRGPEASNMHLNGEYIPVSPGYQPPASSN